MSAALAALLGPAAPAFAQGVAPSAAPAEWVRYAETVTGTISGWLSQEEEAATRFRAYLRETAAAADQPPAALEIKLWIAPDGRVEKIGFTPFVDEQANGDLRAAIVGRMLAAPPVGMLQPLRLQVDMKSEAIGEGARAGGD
ncbi:hypothetical protein [Sphingomonas sanxanigenens]|uniref:hypothetical protein n=1 Tax=Sphingomonas sanxanigenens TaxID=397260 RepID=UPI00130135AC|nr:hypothetical protein [Sphingomonas sanxanigenens]